MFMKNKKTGWKKFTTLIVLGILVIGLMLAVIIGQPSTEEEVFEPLTGEDCAQFTYNSFNITENSILETELIDLAERTVSGEQIAENELLNKSPDVANAYLTWLNCVSKINSGE